MSKRWQQFYGFDGFRFDLMGIIDIETINEIYRVCSDYDSSFILYGEGGTCRQIYLIVKRQCNIIMINY